MGFYQFKREQIIERSIGEVWDFIQNPKNLKIITPDYMGFDIKSEDIPDKMYEGLMISYKVAPLLNIKTTWVTEITHLKEKEYFVKGKMYSIDLEQEVQGFSIDNVSEIDSIRLEMKKLSYNVSGLEVPDTLTIEASDKTSNATVSWLVIGERQDPTIKQASFTDADGHVIVEPQKTIFVEAGQEYNI